MPDEKSNPDELTKTTDDDITLTEGQLNDVSGGGKVNLSDISIMKVVDKSSPL